MSFPWWKAARPGLAWDERKADKAKRAAERTIKSSGGLRRVSAWRIFGCMWDQPYLETCCRSALHRLRLSGEVGRPADLADGPCLVRLASMGLCGERADGRFVINATGARRHQDEVLTRTPVRTAAQ